MTGAQHPEPPMNPSSDLAEALAVAVLVLDPAGVVRYVNASAEELLGLSRRRAVGVALRDLVTLAPEWLERVASATHSNQAFTEREISITPAHARGARHVDATVTPWHLAEWGRVAIVELTPLDRHRRIAREETLRAQEQANRSLLRGVAHEIRNPLAGLRGAAQLLERELDGAELAEYTRIIVREADRLRGLVDRMIGPVRPPTPEAVNIHEVTEHVVQLLRAEAGTGVHIATEYDPSIPELTADRDQLVQALLNLGRNALQAVGDSGTVTVRTRTLRQFTIGHVLHRLAASVEVADDGPGVPQTLIDTLFQPMVSGRADGSGLGLTIAQSLVSRHGGLIECDSEPGATVFRVYLPLESGDG